MDISPVILIQVLRHQIRGGGSRPSMILMTQGVGVQNLGKPDDEILERSLKKVRLSWAKLSQVEGELFFDARWMLGVFQVLRH